MAGGSTSVVAYEDAIMRQKFSRADIKHHLSGSKLSARYVIAKRALSVTNISFAGFGGKREDKVRVTRVEDGL